MLLLALLVDADSYPDWVLFSFVLFGVVNLLAAIFTGVLL